MLSSVFCVCCVVFYIHMYTHIYIYMCKIVYHIYICIKSRTRIPGAGGAHGGAPMGDSPSRVLCSVLGFYKTNFGIHGGALVGGFVDLGSM